jgi:micrococcal nuclease
VKLLVSLVSVLGLLTLITFTRIHQPKHNLKQGIHGTVIKVADGDSITVKTEAGTTEKIRLCGIDAPEKAQPLGQESKRNLDRLAMNQSVAFYPVEQDRYGRTVADVFVLSQQQEIFLNQDQLTSGLAYHYAQYSGKCPQRDVLIDAEGIAKQKRLGVWAGSYQKPWDYRKAQRQ